MIDYTYTSANSLYRVRTSCPSCNISLYHPHKSLVTCKICNHRFPTPALYIKTLWTVALPVEYGINGKAPTISDVITVEVPYPWKHPTIQHKEAT